MISVIVPCLNEETILSESLRRIHAVLSQSGHRHEILVVDDGSTDNSWQVIIGLSKEIAEIRGIRLSRNFGHESATIAGLHNASGDFVSIIDADLQDPPELLPAMMAKVREGYDIVYGIRRHRAGETFLKKITAKIFYRLFNAVSDIKIPRDTGDFRIMTRRAVNAFLTLRESGYFVRGMTTWVGYPQCGIAYNREPRQGGRSKYNFPKLFDLGINAIITSSVRPLRLAVWISFIFFTFAFIILFWAVFSKLAGAAQSSWNLLLATFLATTGIQTFLLGVIGEYLGHIFIETKKRPLYIIQDQASPASQQVSALSPKPIIRDPS